MVHIEAQRMRSPDLGDLLYAATLHRMFSDPGETAENLLNLPSQLRVSLPSDLVSKVTVASSFFTKPVMMKYPYCFHDEWLCGLMGDADSEVIWGFCSCSSSASSLRSYATALYKAVKS